jgi:hypothetical protein
VPSNLGRYFFLLEIRSGTGTKMKNFNLRIVLSAICLASILAAFTKVEAGPIRFDQVVQITNPKPGKADTVNFARLEVANYSGIVVGMDDTDDDDKKKRVGSPQQDGRVITETRTEIIEEEDCECEQPPERGKFPKWALLGLAAIPIAFVLIRRKKELPTPSFTPPTTGTPTPHSPTPKTPTPTPPITPTPTPPEPVPEPMTILLFGTGLASVGLAARRRFGKKADGEGESNDDSE